MLESYTIKLHHEKKQHLKCRKYVFSSTAAKQGNVYVISALKVKSSLGQGLKRSIRFCLAPRIVMSIVKGFNLVAINELVRLCEFIILCVIPFWLSYCYYYINLCCIVMKKSRSRHAIKAPPLLLNRIYDRPRLAEPISPQKAHFWD